MYFKTITAAAVALVALPNVAQAGMGNGAFLGAEIGYVREEVKIELNDLFDLPNLSESGSGLTYGAFIGYDFPVAETMFFGIEATASMSDGDITITDDGDTVTLSGDRTFGLLGRVGFVASERFLIYAKAGYVNGRYEGKAELEDEADISESDSGDGLLYGVGIEIGLTERVGLRGEYRHTNFKDGDLGGFARDEVTGGLVLHF